MLDILLQGLGSFLIGAAVGYGVYKIVETLSNAFVELWEGLVAVAQSIFEYVSEATKHYLALIAQYLDDNWGEIASYLHQQLGFTRNWLIAVFQEGHEAFITFINQQNFQEEYVICSLGIVDNQENIQLPSNKNPMVTVLEV